MTNYMHEVLREGDSHVVTVEMAVTTADLICGVLHRADSGFLTDEEYLEFNKLRQALSLSLRRSTP